MAVLADLRMHEYAVCVMNNVRYYIGKIETPAVYDTELWVCKYAADTNIRIPVVWDNTPGPLPDLNPNYYYPVQSDDVTLLAAAGEVPILYTYGTNLILDVPSHTETTTSPAAIYSTHPIYISKDGVTWVKEYTSSSIPADDLYGNGMLIDNFSSVMSNGVIYYVGSFPDDFTLPDIPELTGLAVDDIVCRAFKCLGLNQYFDPDDLPPTSFTPRTHPVKFPDGKILSKITTDAYIKDNAIRPVLTVSDNVLSVILPTTTIGSYTTYKSHDGGYTWLGV